MFKKQISMLLVVLLVAVFAFTGCKPTAVTPPVVTTPPVTTPPVVTNDPTIPTDTTPKVIGVSVPSADHGWTGGIVYYAQKAIADWKIKDPNTTFKLVLADTAQKQVSDVEDLMAQGIDGLVILPYDSATLTPVVGEVKKAGKYVVVIDRGVLPPVFADVYIAGDNYAFGKQSAEFMVKKLNGKGNILIMEGIPCQVNTDRVTGFKDVLKNYPDIKILADQPANWSRDTGLKLMENWLQQFKTINAVWAGDDDVALGAIQAINEAKRQTEMFIVPGAGMKDIVKMVMDGSDFVPCDVTYPVSMAATAITLGVYGVRNMPVPGFYQSTVPAKIILSADLITKDNAAKYYVPDSIY
jgi:ribose transport system substrate-binding protein